MAKPARVVVVGGSNVDMVVRAPRLPRPGETVLGGTFAMVPGGKGANQAVAAARLGADVTLIASVGADTFGDAAVRGFAAEGIRTDFISRDPDLPTGVALIGVSEATGENCILVAPGANAVLHPAHVERAAGVVRQADVVIVQMEVRLDTVALALETASAAGVTTILNPAPVTPLPDYAWANVSVVTPNRAEMDDLGGDAAALVRLGAGAVVVTLGADGARVVDGNGDTPIRGVAVHSVVDTTAAGDCFTGALAVALGEGRSMADAAAFANVAAALSVTKAGAQPSLPHRRDVEEFGNG